MLAVATNVLLPITSAVAAGYASQRFGKRIDTDSLATVAADFGLPCLIISSLATTTLPLDALALTGVAALLCFVTMTLIGAALLRAANLHLRTYLPAFTWSSSSFLGIPVATNAFGATGLAYATAFSAVSLVFNSVVSTAIVTQQPSIRDIVRNPLIPAVALGLVLNATHARVPASVLHSLSLLGGMAIPVTLIMVGASLAKLRVHAIGRAVAFSISRMVVGASVAFVVGSSLHLTGVQLYTLVLQCSMPVAVLSYILAQRCEADPDEVAGLIVVSTWFAGVSTPALLSVMT